MRYKPIHVTRAASLVIFISAIGSAFAVLREALVAGRLGISVQTDAYFFSYSLVVSIPYFMMDAVKKSLAPIYIHGDQEANRSLVNTVLTLHILFYCGLTLLVIAMVFVFPAYFISGFNQSGRLLVGQMVVLLSPTILAIGLWGMIRMLLEAEGMFLASAVSDTFLSLFVIASLLLTGRDWGIYSLPAGVVLASTAQFIWVAFWLGKKGIRFRPALNFHHPGLKQFLTLFWPPLLAAFLGYTIPIIDREMASHLRQGTISSLSYAEKIVTNLQGVIIIPLNNVLLPSLARESKSEDMSGFKTSVSRTLGGLIFTLTPISILLATLRTPIIQFFYQRGKFDAAAAADTGSIYQWLVLCLMPMACAVTLETVFSSMEDTRTGSFVGVGTKFVAKIILNFVLIAFFGAVGLGLAAPLMYAMVAGLLYLILRRRLRGLADRQLARTLLKTLTAALFAILPVSFLVNHFDAPVFVKAAALVFFGPLLFLGLAATLKIPELQWSVETFLKIMQVVGKRSGLLKLIDPTDGK